jgi:hypothetical protein
VPVVWEAEEALERAPVRERDPNKRKLDIRVPEREKELVALEEVLNQQLMEDRPSILLAQTV